MGFSFQDEIISCKPEPVTFIPTADKQNLKA